MPTNCGNRQGCYHEDDPKYDPWNMFYISGMDGKNVEKKELAKIKYQKLVREHHPDKGGCSECFRGNLFFNNNYFDLLYTVMFI